jgi:SAM-dependent methyltransferase
MSVNYNKIAKWFSESRKQMKWEEIDYFISEYLSDFEWKSFLDIWCGSGRLLEQFSNSFDISKINYLWLDLSNEMLKHARKNFPEKEFLELNMLDLDKLKWRKFDYIFFIASFHHLENFQYRLEVLEEVKELLNDNWLIFMTNWSLESEVNHERYKSDIIEDSQNEYWSLDYKIYFSEYPRYYHWFSLEELEHLFNENNFEIIENREFDSKRNFVSIIKKK